MKEYYEVTAITVDFKADEHSTYFSYLSSKNVLDDAIYFVKSTLEEGTSWKDLQVSVYSETIGTDMDVTGYSEFICDPIEFLEEFKEFEWLAEYEDNHLVG